MLKIMEDKMEHDDNKWLEDQLKTRPQLNKNGFNARVMAEIDLLRVKQKKLRKLVLQAAYVFSSILLLFMTPWNWIIAKFTEAQNQITAFQAADLLAVEKGSQLPILGLSIIFIVSLSLYILTQEED